MAEGEEEEGEMAQETRPVSWRDNETLADHLLRGAREEGSPFSLVFFRAADRALDRAEAVSEAMAAAAVPFTCAIAMDAEGAAILRAVVPVVAFEHACPVFDVEVLPHAPIEGPDAFHGAPPQHHKARLSDDVRVEPTLQPPRKEFVPAMDAGGDAFSAEASEFVVQWGGLYVFFAVVVMFAGDKSDGGMGIEDFARAREIGKIPEVVLEEELEVGTGDWRLGTGRSCWS